MSKLISENYSPVHKRYALGLFTVLSPEGREKVWEHLPSLLTVAQTKNFVSLFQNPILESKEKEAILKSLFPALDETWERFLVELVRSKRAHDLAFVLFAWKDLYFRKNQIVPVKIKSTKNLDEGFMEQLRAFLDQSFGSRKYHFEVEVQPELTAGFVISVEGKELDFSLRQELQSHVSLIRTISI